MLATLSKALSAASLQGKRKDMFSTLPIELIEHILSYLGPEDKQTSAALCRANKLLYEIATPLLYRSIGIVRDDMDQHERSRRLQLLLRTLSQNLPLTQHVEEIAQYIDEHSVEERPVEGGLEIAGIQDLLSRDLDLPMNVFEYLHTTEDEISEECCLLTLLAICPKATTLSLMGKLSHLRDWEGLEYITFEIRAAEEDGEVAHHEETSFHTIQHVDLEDRGFDDRLDMKGLEPLLRLPSLRTLCLDTFHQQSFSPPTNRPPFLASRVETLEIGPCFAKGEDLDELLALCSNLKTLSIEWPSREDNYRRFDWADLGNSIRENCPNLQHLHFDHPRDFMLDDDDFRNMVGQLNDEYLQHCHLPGLGSLRSLLQLQSLHASDIALFGTHRDDSFVPADFSDSDNEDDEVKHCLDSVLPDSMKELVVFCEDQGLRREDIAILNEPGAERMEQLTIMDCQQDHWIARKHGHLTASTPRLLERAQQQ